MINDRTIDLTEHNDFNHSDIIFEGDILDTDIVRRAIRVNSFQTLSSDDYEKLSLYKRFFGLKNHIDESDDLFDKEGQFERYLEKRCARCGKLLRVPWKRHYGLCFECNQEYEHVLDDSSFGYYSKFPWNRGTSQNRDDRDVLSLRLKSLKEKSFNDFFFITFIKIKSIIYRK